MRRSTSLCAALKLRYEMLHSTVQIQPGLKLDKRKRKSRLPAHLLFFSFLCFFFFSRRSSSPLLSSPSSPRERLRSARSASLACAQGHGRRGRAQSAEHSASGAPVCWPSGAGRQAAGPCRRTNGQTGGIAPSPSPQASLRAPQMRGVSKRFFRGQMNIFHPPPTLSFSKCSSNSRRRSSSEGTPSHSGSPRHSSVAASQVVSGLMSRMCLSMYWKSSRARRACKGSRAVPGGACQGQMGCRHQPTGCGSAVQKARVVQALQYTGLPVPSSLRGTPPP